MNTIFEIVYQALKQVSAITGLTYNEINIITYYIIIPIIYFVMIDKILNKHIVKIVFSVLVVITIIVVDFEKFSNLLFNQSVIFLLSFKVIGLDYTVASVMICVVMPVILFSVLFYFSYWSDLEKFIKKILASN